MNKLTSYAALVAAALFGGVAESAWYDETTANETAAPAEQPPAPAASVIPGWYPPPNQSGYAQTWQQPPRWPAPQQGYGQFPPRYPAGGQYQAYPAAPATAPAVRENPLGTKLKQTREELAAKNSELDEARSTLEELRAKLQDSLATEAKLSDKIAYSTREQQALRVRVTELIDTVNTSRTTLEQQHQLINNHQAQIQQLSAERDQLHSELASRDEQLAALQSELQVAQQAIEALDATKAKIAAHRDELTRLEAGLEQLQTRLRAGTENRD
ncbi:MAG: hypothetical protein WBO34_09050 [Gammaproteobacteria bacterium]